MGRLTAAPGYRSIYPVDPMPAAIAALRSGAEPVWVFAYGSLMWNPEFPFEASCRALLYGYHRRFCLYSRDYRGTPEEPGLVLGLDRGGSCHGIAYRLPAARTAAALDYIWAREMTGQVYTMRRVAVRTADKPLAAHACIVRRESPDYAGRLPLDEVARLLARAVGQRGSGRDYLTSTLRHLDRLAIRDTSLQRIAALVARLPETAAPRYPESARQRSGGAAAQSA